jgi:hypothetical protein
LLRRVDLAALQAQFCLVDTHTRGDLAEASGSHTALIAIADQRIGLGNGANGSLFPNERARE